MTDPDLWLAARLAELAECADADGSEAACAAQLTASLARLLVPAEVGLMLADRAGAMTVVAASTARARELAEFELRHLEGPGTTCGATARPVINARVSAAAARWPKYTRAADAAGVRIVSALPMRRRAETIGVVGLFLPGTRKLSAPELDRARVLVRAGAVAVSQLRQIQHSALVASQLRQALDSRVLIEQAKGAIAARLGIGPDEAFGLLRAFARRSSRALADVAGQAVSGELRAHQLLGRPADGSLARHRIRARAGQSR